MNKSIALFDFDGTITNRDSLLELIRYSRGSRRFWIGFFLLSPWLLAMKLHWISNSAAKERVLKYFFGHWSEERFSAVSIAFVQEVMPGLVREKAREAIQEHLNEGSTVAVVTASPEHYMKPWCDRQGLYCLATRLEVREGMISGRIAGKNCHGEEKVRRIREIFNLSDFDEIFAYGDSPGDRPMLALAGKAHYRPFRK
jgi:phosphatidylglycerophosphatase C